jgi:hypothetical protein
LVRRSHACAFVFCAAEISWDPSGLKQNSELEWLQKEVACTLLPVSAGEEFPDLRL